MFYYYYYYRFSVIFPSFCEADTSFGEPSYNAGPTERAVSIGSLSNNDDDSHENVTIPSRLMLANFLGV